MAFQIKLRTNLSEPERVDKSFVELGTVTGELKEESSLLDPVILIDGALSDLVSCNYITIESFGRSYFVTEPVSFRSGLCELICHVDVLTSWKNQLINNRAIVNRQETRYNLYLNDGSIKTYSNPHVKTLTFPSGFSAPEFILAVAGASNASSSTPSNSTESEELQNE